MVFGNKIVRGSGASNFPRPFRILAVSLDEKMRRFSEGTSLIGPCQHSPYILHQHRLLHHPNQTHFPTKPYNADNRSHDHQYCNSSFFIDYFFIDYFLFNNSHYSTVSILSINTPNKKKLKHINGLF